MKTCIRISYKVPAKILWQKLLVIFCC